MYAQRAKNWLRYSDYLLFDVLCLQVALVLAYMTRHGLSFPYSDQLYVIVAAFYALADVLVLVVSNTMDRALRRGRYREMVSTIKHVAAVTVGASAFLFTVRFGDAYSRAVFYLTAVYYLMMSYVVRVLWKRSVRRSKNRRLSASVFIVTTSERAKRVVENFEVNNDGGYLLQGMCILDQDRTGTEIAGVPVTASREGLLAYLCDKWVDEVFVSVPVNGEYPESLINAITEMGIVVHIHVEQMNIQKGQRQSMERFAGSAVRTLSMNVVTYHELILKRAMDIAGGLVGCMLTLILAAVVGPFIYIKSPGPIFFKQTRIGRNGRKFKVYKFRSMYMDAEARKKELMDQNRVQSGLMFKLEYDPRIIGCQKLPDGTVKKGIGNFIRDWSIDEFPQFFNVLKGEMSLCGTRPPTVDEWEKYERHHRARMAMKPGITGLWQISGRSNITDFEQVVELDKKYIREWNLGLDIKILLETVKVVLTKSGSM